MLNIKTRINKEIAHLTWERKYSNDPSKNWELFTIFNKLLKSAQIFIRNLPKDLIKVKIKFLADYLK